MTTINEALTRLAESRQALHQAIEGLSQEDMTQVQVEGVWTGKDILGHIVTWEEVCLEPLRRYADGGPFEVEVIENYMAWNDEQAARKRSIPLAAILEELAAIREKIVTAAGELSPERQERQVTFPWGEKGTVAEMLDRLHRHELEHARNIQRWRGD